MAVAQNNLVPIDAPKSEFERAIDSEGNKLIFFSGRFGIGKTFFLQRFFEIHADKYDTYHLFPVRYQISSNENVVELLKYDILVELLKKYPDAFKNGKEKGVGGTFRLFAAFCKDRELINRFLKSAVETGEGVLSLSPDPLFQALGKLGRPLSELLVLDKEFQEFKKEHLSGDKRAIEKFLKEVQAEGDIVATDYISHLLVERIGVLKGKKRSVLILDDFDRMDPEHIFRILNVLSAHMEGDEDNKFGFDHIVIVGDIRNLQSIFHHRYGEQTEFWGYFDKFFTVEPFIFNNERAIAESIPLLLQSVKCEDQALKTAFGKSGIIKGFMHEILGRALTVGKLNVRQLYKPLMHSFPQLRLGIYSKDIFTDNWNQCIDIGVKLLIAVYGGDKQNFLNVLHEIRKSNAVVAGPGNNWQYREYSSSMLRHLMPLEIGKDASWLGKYEIVSVQDGSNSSRKNIYPKDENTANPAYFYDTLIAYVSRSMYEKQHNRDYSI